MIVRLDKKEDSMVRHQLLTDVVWTVCNDTLRRLWLDKQLSLTPTEVFLSARQFCNTVLGLSDIDEGIDYEMDDLEDEATGENDAMVVMMLATAQLQALSKRHNGEDIRKIILRIYGRLNDHPLFSPLLEQFANKEEAQWLQGKRFDLLNYEIREIKLDGGGSVKVKAFMDKYIQATLTLTPDEIKSTLIVLSSLNKEYGHAFDEHIAILCNKLGIKPNEIHNHFEKDSGCQVFNGPTTGQFGKKQ